MISESEKRAFAGRGIFACAVDIFGFDFDFSSFAN